MEGERKPSDNMTYLLRHVLSLSEPHVPSFIWDKVWWPFSIAPALYMLARLVDVVILVFIFIIPIDY